VIPDLSVVWVVLIVLALAVVLSRWLVRPLTRVMDERAARVKSATDLAEATAAKARTAAAEFESRTRAAQAEIYRAMDDRRRAALEERAGLVARTRQEVDQTLADAQTALDRQTAEARARLEQDADRLGAAVVERVLGRRSS
jgi:F-type H+-transporting ATPase subunit b